MIRVAINGFGRIGRMVLRAGIDNPDIEFVAINDLGDANNLAYLLNFDSVHGRFKYKAEVEDGDIIVNGRRIKVLHEKNPEKLPWKELGIDVVAECTGIFRTREGGEMHLRAGARRVVLSAPPKGEGYVKTIVMGVNEHELSGEDKVISNASCTTNCMAPVAKVINDNFRVKRAFMTTAHGYTANQRIVDGPHKDFRRGRAAAVNLVPTTSGAAKSVVEVIPDLRGKFHSSAIRVPVPCGSLIYLVCAVEKWASVEEVNRLFENVSKYHLKGILEYCTEPLVSEDIIGNPHSCILDSALTETDGDLIKLVVWYDNEWGYSCRMVDLMERVGKLLGK